MGTQEPSHISVGGVVSFDLLSQVLRQAARVLSGSRERGRLPTQAGTTVRPAPCGSGAAATEQTPQCGDVWARSSPITTSAHLPFTWGDMVSAASVGFPLVFFLVFIKLRDWIFLPERGSVSSPAALIMRNIALRAGENEDTLPRLGGRPLSLALDCVQLGRESADRMSSPLHFLVAPSKGLAFAETKNKSVILGSSELDPYSLSWLRSQLWIWLRGCHTESNSWSAQCLPVTGAKGTWALLWVLSEYIVCSLGENKRVSSSPMTCLHSPIVAPSSLSHLLGGWVL